MNGRYDRQLLLPEVGAEGQEKLSHARVLLVGVGGLGSPVALYLAGAGVGTLGLIDGDTVSTSNLQRQVLYTESDVGKPKVQCAARRLQALNSTVAIEEHPGRLTAENARLLISRYDLVVDCCDNFATRFLIDDTCAELHKPFVHGAIRAFDGQVAVFNHPYGHSRYRTLYPDEQQLLALPSPPKGVLGVTPGIVGTVQASETVKLICGIGTPLIDRLWTIDLLTMQSYVIEL